MQKFFTLLALGLFTAIWALVATAGDAVKGAAFFTDINGGHCVSCHYTDGRKLVGPGLENVTQRHSEAWLHQFLSNPQETWEGDDAETMELKKRVRKLRAPVTLCRKSPMSDTQRDDLITYLKTLQE